MNRQDKDPFWLFVLAGSVALLGAAAADFALTNTDGWILLNQTTNESWTINLNQSRPAVCAPGEYSAWNGTDFRCYTGGGNLSGTNNGTLYNVAVYNGASTVVSTSTTINPLTGDVVLCSDAAADCAFYLNSTSGPGLYYLRNQNRMLLRAGPSGRIDTDASQTYYETPATTITSDLYSDTNDREILIKNDGTKGANLRVDNNITAGETVTTPALCLNGECRTNWGSLTTTWEYSGRQALTPLQDASGNGNNAALNGSGFYSPTDKTYSFAGISNYINATNSTYTIFDTDFTFSMWIKANATGAGSARIDFASRESSGNAGWYLRKDTNSGTVFMYIGNGSFQSAGSLPISTNVLLHVTYIKNGSVYSRYANGAYVGQTTLNTIKYSPVSLRLGTSSASSATINSTIGDVRVWNRALSAAEVATVYANGTVASGLVAWYPFLNQTAIPAANYTTLQLQRTPEPPNATPGTFWANWDDNETYVRSPVAWEALT